MKNKLMSGYYRLKSYQRRKRTEKFLQLNNGFTVEHENSSTFLISIDSPGALVALHFVIFRLAEERFNIKICLGPKILYIYNPFLYRWQSLNCVQFLSQNELLKLTASEEHYLITDQESIRTQSRHSLILKDHEEKSNLPILPYTLHSLQIFSGKLFFLKELRSNLRENHIVFSGNYDEKYYLKSFAKYPRIINRFSVLEYLESQFSDKLDYDLHSKEKKNDNILWLKWSSKNHDYKNRIDEHEWLRFLSKSHFFLALPGVHMPMSHNIIESMSVGTIPITQYHDHFSPPLEHGKNCIVYKDLEDLRNRILELFEMPKDKIEQMHVEVIKYFDSHIDPKSLIDKIINGEIKEAQYHNEY